MAAPTTEPNQSLQPEAIKGASVKSIIKKLANINTPNAKHPKNFSYKSSFRKEIPSIFT